MFERLKERFVRRAIAFTVIVPVAFCVIAFLALAGYFALLDSLSPALSALVTAAGGIVVIAVVMLFTRIATRAGLRREAPDSDMPDEIEKLLQQHADPVLSEWIRKNPDRAVIAMLLIGVAAGYSKSLQKILLDMYSRYSEAESPRRTNRRD